MILNLKIWSFPEINYFVIHKMETVRKLHGDVWMRFYLWSYFSEQNFIMFHVTVDIKPSFERLE